ncbi:hypothetical protein TRFO_09117 [Tritrichomonas foetus]|uniref:Uncharacterized protein n=1 Tax=Tritrichomonas foetus TaxID=1144522 RepID=A0A1J4JFI1_9EUKA|nr:hypothetical protein TRFO_09117 [Tritrichomonas foetus]|eukprot:OHS97974.1 hypothetical protein TRFO_09117 [Tritrichomonas foetus]
MIRKPLPPRSQSVQKVGPGVRTIPEPPPFLMAQSFLNDQTCISLRERLETDTNLSDADSDTLQKLIIHLKETEEIKASEENYSEAKKMKAFQEIVRNEIRIRTLKEMKQISRSAINSAHKYTQNFNSLANQSKKGSRTANCSPSKSEESNDCDDSEKSETDQSFKSINEKYHEKLEKFDLETNEKREHLMKRQQQCIERFENSWTNEIPKQYNKPSYKLLQIKQVERTLAKTGDYDRATALHKEAADLAMIEGQQNQAKLVNDYKSAKSKLIEKHRKEVELFESNRNESRHLIQTRHEIELKAAMNRNIVMQQKLKERTMSKQRQLQYNFGQRKYSVPIASKLKYKPISQVYASNKSLGATLLPPLKPPTNETIQEEEERKKREKAKMAADFKRKQEEERRRKIEIMQRNYEEQQQRIIQEKAERQKQRNNRRNQNNTFITEIDEENNIIQPIETFNDPSSNTESNIHYNTNSSHNGNTYNDNNSHSNGDENAKSEEKSFLDYQINKCEDQVEAKCEVQGESKDEYANDIVTRNTTIGEIKGAKTNRNRNISLRSISREETYSKSSCASRGKTSAIDEEEGNTTFNSELAKFSRSQPNLVQMDSIPNISSTSSNTGLLNSESECDQSLLPVNSMSDLHTLSLPLDGQILDEMERHPSVLSQAPSTIDISQYSKNVNV